MQSAVSEFHSAEAGNGVRGTPSELVKGKIATSATRSSVRRLAHARKSLRGAIKAACRIAKTQKLHAVAMTLTYARGETPCPRDISRFLERLRKRLHRIGQPLLYAWVLERSSILHYHLILWLPRNFKLTLDKLWHRGSTWISRCQSVSAWSRYLQKAEGKSALPKNSNLFGYGGLDLIAKMEIRRARLPRWLIERLPFCQLAQRISGIGWANLATGDIYTSPFAWSPGGWIKTESGDISGATQKIQEETTSDESAQRKKKEKQPFVMQC